MVVRSCNARMDMGMARKLDSLCIRLRDNCVGALREPARRQLIMVHKMRIG
jgi:hypothetical protein